MMPIQPRRSATLSLTTCRSGGWTSRKSWHRCRPYATRDRTYSEVAYLGQRGLVAHTFSGVRGPGVYQTTVVTTG